MTAERDATTRLVNAAVYRYEHEKWAEETEPDPPEFTGDGDDTGEPMIVTPRHVCERSEPTADVTSRRRRSTVRAMSARVRTPASAP